MPGVKGLGLALGFEEGDDVSLVLDFFLLGGDFGFEAAVFGGEFCGGGCAESGGVDEILEEVVTDGV